MARAAADALRALTGDVVARGLGFAAVIHLTATLGPSGFGVVTVGLSVLTYALWLVDLGLNTLGIREAARPAGSRGTALRRIVVLELFLAAAVFLAGQVLLTLLPVDPQVARVVRLYLWYTFSYAILLDWYHQGIRNYGAVTISKFINGVIYAGGVYLLVRSEQDMSVVPLVQIAANLAAAGWLLLRARSEDFKAGNAGGGLRPYRDMLRMSLPIGVGALLAQGIQALPPIAVALYHGTAETGVLGTVLRMATTLMMADRIFIALFLPAVSAMWAKGSDRMTETLTTALKWVVTGGCSLSVVITLCAESILTTIFGAEYAPGSRALAILSWYPAVTLLNSYFAYSLIAAGRERSYLRVSVISAVASAVMILLFTRLWGAEGAAAAIVAGEVVMTAIMYREFRGAFQVRVVRALLPTVAVAAVVIAGGELLGLGDITLAPLLWLAFAALSLLVGGISRRDIELITGR